MFIIGLLFIYGNIVAENKCGPGWNFESDNCIDVDECKQKGKEIDLSEDICEVSTWTTYSKGQEVSEKKRFYSKYYIILFIPLHCYYMSITIFLIIFVPCDMKSFVQICSNLGGKLFEPRSTEDLDWLMSLGEDFYLGIIWSDGKWRYASDNVPLVNDITNWKKGKESGSDEKSCVKFKHKGEGVIQISLF